VQQVCSAHSPCHSAKAKLTGILAKMLKQWQIVGSAVQYHIWPAQDFKLQNSRTQRCPWSQVVPNYCQHQDVTYAKINDQAM